MLTWTWTGIYSPEVEIEQFWNNLRVTWFVLRGSAEEFSHFKYSISWNDIYISGYMKPLAILFRHRSKPLDITLGSGIYNIYYKNSDASIKLVRSINVK